MGALVDELRRREAAARAEAEEEDAGRPLRAAQIAAAAGLSTDKAKVETLRSKLKRLVERGWLAEEAGPGLFALPARAGNGTGEAAGAG